METKKCIMPECPYCPACKYGYIYQSPDWDDGTTEWNCLLTDEDWRKENEQNKEDISQTD